MVKELIRCCKCSTLLIVGKMTYYDVRDVGTLCQKCFFEYLDNKKKSTGAFKR